MKVYYTKKTGYIQLRHGRRTFTFPPNKRDAAYDLIKKMFGKNLGGVIVDDLKRKLA